MRLPFSRRRYEPPPQPVGVVLAGGLGRRMGGRKTIVELASRPLISYPLGALSAVLSEVAVIAKADTELPSLPGVTVWIEPQTPRHPLVGIVQALGLAGERPVFVCAADMPFVTPEVVIRLAHADPGGAPAVIASERGVGQPLLGCYRPAAARMLSGGVREGVPVREAVARIGPRLLEVDDPDELFNVNT
ncbi:MAG TPA: NTP transferase domain-containing protein, partial [Solirubrobacteraceae bacterium]|nr:NTP transferase domain-containing protein [Solirubrobacteraceae bacterium]